MGLRESSSLLVRKTPIFGIQLLETVNWACLLSSCITDRRAGTMNNKARWEFHTQSLPVIQVPQPWTVGDELGLWTGQRERFWVGHLLFQNYLELIQRPVATILSVPQLSHWAALLGEARVWSVTPVAHFWMCSSTFPVRTHLLLIGLLKLRNSFSQKYVGAPASLHKTERRFLPVAAATREVICSLMEPCWVACFGSWNQVILMPNLVFSYILCYSKIMCVCLWSLQLPSLNPRANMKRLTKCWGDGPAVNSAVYSPRGLGLDSQHPDSGSQLSVTLVPGYQCSILACTSTR